MKTLFLSMSFLVLLFHGIPRAADFPQIKVGGEVRMRGYYLSNFLDFDDSDKRDEWGVLRLRTRVSFSAAVDENVSAYVRIGNQHYSEGVTAVPSTAGDRWEEENKSNKFFVDAAYIDVKNLLGLPLDIQLGRQNITYGSGWVILDGQSQYGSTSTYLDGIRLQWRIRSDVTLDGLYMKDEEKKRDNVTPDDITFGGLYLVSKYPLPVGQQEIYGLGRFDQLIGKEIYMVGGRLSSQYEFGLDYSAEGAWQTGMLTREIDQNAYGLKVDVGYKFKGAVLTPRLFGQFVRMTGDDYGTSGTNEAWDVFYGGWPQYGDLLAWKYANAGTENAISIYDPNYSAGSSVPFEAVYSNFNLFTGGIDIRPIEAIKASFSYSKLLADKTYNGIDDDIGNYYQVTIDCRYSKHLTFGVYAALIDPGAAFGGRSDPAREAYWDATLGF